MKDMMYLLTVMSLFLGIMLFLMITYIFIRQYREKQHIKKLERYYQNNSNSLYQYLLEGAPLSNELFANSTFKVKAIEYMLDRYMKNIYDPSAWAKIAQYADEQLAPYYQKELKSKRRSHRINVLYRIIGFHMKSLVEEVDQMLHGDKKYSTEEYIQMYLALASVNDPRVVDYIVAGKVVFHEYEYRTVFLSLQEERVEQLLCHSQQLSPSVKCALIDVIGVKNMLDCSKELEEWLGHEEYEIRLRIIKAACKLGYVHQFQSYIPSFASEHWEERMLVVRLFGIVSLPEAQMYIRNLEADSSWWVCQEVRRSLASK